MDANETAQMRDTLTELLEEPSRCFRMRWQVGDLAIIDNRALACRSDSERPHAFAMGLGSLGIGR